MIDPRTEPCSYCGLDMEACICGLEDVADQDPLRELTVETDEWDAYASEDDDLIPVDPEPERTL